MSGARRGRRWWRWLRRYLPFFLFSSFVMTCCMLLFLTLLQGASALVISADTFPYAALMTFGNVVWISLLFTCVDALRRRIAVDRPVRRITQGAEKMMHGDFSARIEPVGWLDAQEGFNVIIDCFNRMAAELAGMETLRNDFIANVSHELKTPLSVLQNYAALLARPGLTEAEREEYAAAIGQASRRMADLIGNILKLNKLENQQIYPKQERFDLSEQLRQCLLGFERVWEKGEIEVEADIDEQVFVEGDAELLSLVWNNLLSNAFKFTPPGGQVTLRLRGEGEQALVEVEDTGCGMTPEVCAHIFEKFYQGDRSHATQGNGLGLALVRRVVDIVHGELTVRSAPGEGSLFAVRIGRMSDGAC